MASKQKGLGRGLGALIKDSSPAEPAPAAQTSDGVRRVPVNGIRKSPWQPRRRFEQEALNELVASVRERGVLQPLLVREQDNHFELIAGERRLRAAQEAGIVDVPVIVMDVTDREALELALVENLQRSDLNLVEEAEGYRLLAEKFNLTQDDIAQRVGKARSSIANALRLLDLPDAVKRHVAERSLTPGHAKALLGLPDPLEQEKLASRVIEEDMSVRTLERVVARARKVPKKARAEKPDVPSSHIQYLLERLHQHLGSQVRITPSRTLANGKKAKGTIEIDYYSSDDLNRIVEALGLNEEL